MAKGKYAASKESLDQFKPAEKQVLLPLTGSMYVPGHIKDARNVIVEIGTGYYMEQVFSFRIHIFDLNCNAGFSNLIKILFSVYVTTKYLSFLQDVESGKDYFKRKVDFVSEQMEKIEILGFEKSKIRDAIIDVMEIKIQQLKQSKPQDQAIHA